MTRGPGTLVRSMMAKHAFLTIDGISGGTGSNFNAVASGPKDEKGLGR